MFAPAGAAELRQPLPGAHAFVEVRVVRGPGEVLESATVVVRDGTIEAVGVDLEPPPDAAIIQFERGDEQPPMTLYAGLIDAHLAVEIERESSEQPEPPAGRHPLVHSDFRLGTSDWPADKVEAHRRAGFTTGLLAPASGLFRGQSLLANLGQGGLAKNLLREDVAQHANLHEKNPGGGYPQSLMGSVALLRQTLLDARWQQQARRAWQANPAQPRPDWLEGLDSLAPVLAGSQPLVFESRDTHDSLRILALLDREFDLALIGHGSEYQRLGAFDRKVVHILPLDFPSAPDIDDDNDRDVGLEELRHWRLAPENPARMIAAGFPVLLTAHGQSSPSELFEDLARAIERGLNADQALAALTIWPAKWLGIDDRAGRVEPGFMANLVVVEGELLVEKPVIREVWVDGHRYELAKLEPPTVDPAGTWSLTLALPGMGEVDAELVLVGQPASLTGTLTVMGNESPLTEARVSGKQLRVRIDASRLGGAGTISINLDIEGERGRGHGSGPFGEFTVRGRRTGGPGDEEIL
ncbi:MAG: amidohydrolase family protein [Xanthomonadaceae bacterium]|nr:amidohydrolase family protein [Xanthomonadaceae bacterium]